MRQSTGRATPSRQNLQSRLGPLLGLLPADHFMSSCKDKRRLVDHFALRWRCYEDEVLIIPELDAKAVLPKC